MNDWPLKFGGGLAQTPMLLADGGEAIGIQIAVRLRVVVRIDQIEKAPLPLLAGAEPRIRKAVGRIERHVQLRGRVAGQRFVD